MMSRVWISAIFLLCASLTAQARVETDELDSLDLWQPVIQGGTAVTANDAIAQVTHLIYRSDNRYCTGTLIAKDLILTAGHCVPESSTVKMVTVRDFGLQGTVSEIAKKGKITKVIGFIRHPDYRVVIHKISSTAFDETSENDVAVLRLAETLPNATVATLPTADTRITPSDPLTIAGYGMTNPADRFLEASKRILSLQRADVAIALQGPNPSTFTIRGPLNTCTGDSGGPSFAQNSDGLVIVGLHSSSNGCTNADTDPTATGTDVYVPYYTDWIKEAARTLRSQRSL